MRTDVLSDDEIDAREEEHYRKQADALRAEVQSLQAEIKDHWIPLAKELDLMVTRYFAIAAKIPGEPMRKTVKVFALDVTSERVWIMVADGLRAPPKAVLCLDRFTPSCWHACQWERLAEDPHALIAYESIDEAMQAVRAVYSTRPCRPFGRCTRE